MPGQAEPAQRRLALLIATSDYSDPALRQLRAPGRDATDLAAVLGAPQIGGFTVQTLINARCGELQEAIEDFCADRRPGDQLLIYLSCHGVLDNRGRLYYAATDTRRQRTAATAVAAAWLNERLEDCRARSQIVILDCCHSGAFASGAKGPLDLALEERFKPHGRGRVVLTASRGTEYSFEGDRASGEGVRSVFTQAIVDGLRTGDADRNRNGLITVTDIYHHVYQRVRAAEPRQTPELWTYGAEGDVLLAYSVRGAVIEPILLAEDLRFTLESPRPRVRETAVAELAEVLDGGPPGLVLSARQALQQISDEDIPRVAAVARVALEAPEGTAAREVSKELADREQARREAEEAARRQAEEQARRETEQAARRQAEEQARRETEQAARRQAEEQARREALRGKADTPSPLGEDRTNTPGSESGPGKEAPRAWRLRATGRAMPRRLVFIGIGAAIAAVAAVGLLAAILIVSGAPSPNVRWVYTTGSFFYSGPAVAGGTVYIGTSGGYMYALNAATGPPRWIFTKDSTTADPAVAGGTVYIGNGDGKVYALNAATGHPRWTYATSFGFSGPAVADGTVYVGSYDDKVHALNAATGHPRWTYTTGGSIFSSPAVAGGTVYVGSYDDNVYALNAATGHPRWTYTTGGPILSSPAVAGGTVYIGSYDDKVYALDAVTGQARWTYTTGGPILSSPAVAGGTVYIGSKDHKVYALDAATGHPRWTYTTGGPIFSSPAVAGGTVYIGSTDGKVYALNATTGNPLWIFSTASFIGFRPEVADGVGPGPAVAGDTVYIGSYDGKVYALNAAGS